MNFLHKHRVIILVILILVLLIALLPKLQKLTLGEFIALTSSSLPLASLVFLGIYALKSIIMIIPVTVLFIAAGAVFPTGWAIGLTYVCLLLEMSIGYHIGKWLDERKVHELIEKKPLVNQYIQEHKNQMQTLCFISRILPVPFDLISMFCGATGMIFWKYIILSLLGSTPAMLPYVLAGSAILHPLSVEFLLPFGISISISLVVFIVFQKMTKRRTLKESL